MGSAALGTALAPNLLSAEKPQTESQPRSHAAVKGQKPNILWVTTEGVPLNALSCYGSQFIKTPNIDRLANEGMKFENSFTTNALCAPS
ncbi:MAG TPA: sulfatase-like hydrolase/transferase, partial [Acidobacteriaceae bacterium]|nr:sulfatase-like hydrolase/transferase [Acidobacteriaceae bacterium]